MPMHFHYYEPKNGHGLAHDPMNAIVGPRVIGWIGTYNANGALNLAPYSFFNLFNYQPPIIGFASLGLKDSVRNILETGEFSWNLATKPLAKQMNLSSIEAPVEEFNYANLTPTTGKQTQAPRVAESPVSFECRLTQHLRLKDHQGKAINTYFVFGEVLAVYIHKKLLKNGIYQTALAKPILRAGGRDIYFNIHNAHTFKMPRPTLSPTK